MQLQTLQQTSGKRQLVAIYSTWHVYSHQKSHIACDCKKIHPLTNCKTMKLHI